MKNIILTLILLAGTCLVSNATIRVVYNNTPSPGQFTTLDAAIAASGNNDTIYVQPSPFTYPAATISKPIKIFGPGLAPEKPNSQTATIAGLSMGANGTAISGFVISGQVTFFNSATNNHFFSRCHFVGGVYFYNNNGHFGTYFNINFNECIWPGHVISFSTVGDQTFNIVNNLTFNNCIILLSSSLGGAFVYSNNGSGLGSNWNFNQCLFYGTNNGSNTASNLTWFPFSMNFNSCIFSKISFNAGGNAYVGNSSFNNCLTFGCNNNTPWTFDANYQSDATGSNIANQDPQFVTPAVYTGSWSYARNYYQLQPTSPALMANHAGAIYNIGPYGGSGVFNWGNANTTYLPVMHSILISNPTIQSGQNLNIDVISKERD